MCVSVCVCMYDCVCATFMDKILCKRFRLNLKQRLRSVIYLVHNNKTFH